MEQSEVQPASEVEADSFPSKSPLIFVEAERQSVSQMMEFFEVLFRPSPEIFSVCVEWEMIVFCPSVFYYVDLSVQKSFVSAITTRQMYRVSHNLLGGGHRDIARFKYHVLYIKLMVF